MSNDRLALGLDTSNYTTSAALVGEDGTIVEDLRKPLKVKQGERGLRQSHALFQHIENLPVLLQEILNSSYRQQIAAVAASDRPRPTEGSYMPVFNAGLHFGSVVAASLQVPFFRFSHQEGHLAAALSGTCFPKEKEFLAWHLSGGTCELLSVRCGKIVKIGGSKDISFGQLIDRVGVSMGLSFPCGSSMDRGAICEKDAAEKEHASGARRDNPLKPIPITDLYFNLSGIETQAQRLLSKEGKDFLSLWIFQRISLCLSQVTARACSHTGLRRVLFTGGVSASAFLREDLYAAFRGGEAEPVFGQPSLSSDNAVGIAFLGGSSLWR